MKTFLNRLEWALLHIGLVAVLTSGVGIAVFYASGVDFWLYDVFGPLFETACVCILLHMIVEKVNRLLSRK